MNINGDQKIVGNVTLAENASAEVRNMYIERVSSIQEETIAASLGLPHYGRIVFNLTSGTLRVWNGGSFQTVGGNIAQFQAELESQSTNISELTVAAADLTGRVDENESIIQSITTSVGLQGNGVFQPIGGSFYLDGTLVIAEGLLTLDAKLKEVEDLASTTQFTQEFTDATFVTVNHNKGKKYIPVIVVDALDQQIVPQSVAYIDQNSLLVVLDTTSTGTVIVS